MSNCSIACDDDDDVESCCDEVTFVAFVAFVEIPDNIRCFANSSKSLRYCFV